MNYYSDESDWQWLFKKAIDWNEIIPLYYPNFPTEDGFNSKEEVLNFLEEIVSSVGQWSGDSVRARAQRLDHEGAGVVKDGKTFPGNALSELYKEARDLEIVGLVLPKKYGGMNVPATLQFIALNQLSRSCISSSTQIAFFTSIAEMAHKFLDEETSARIVPQIIQMNLSGSMNLTEPGCGSDLGMIKTSATPIENDKFLLNGQKIFITNGGGGVQFVLARIKGEVDGLAGISLFFVEQKILNSKGEEILNYKVSKNEEKMGMHGSFTCVIDYEDTIASLVGKKNEGFKYMLHLMNEARIAVGMQGLGGIECALDHAINYAEEREQFGKPIAELPLMKRNIEDLVTERDAIRALLMDTISYFDQFLVFDAKRNKNEALTPSQNKQYKIAEMWTRKRTPLVKYYACEKFTEISTKAIQILGGYGYMQEYPLERIHRDSFGPLLYEGTSQIQALMSLKDLIKEALKNPPLFIQNILRGHPILAMLKGETKYAVKFKKINYRFEKMRLKLILSNLKPKSDSFFNLAAWKSEDGPNRLMAHAETLCQALSYIETLRVLTKHAEMDKSRIHLLAKYKDLVGPRLEAIYIDWSKLRE